VSSALIASSRTATRGSPSKVLAMR
jgi:hypothetical protein